MAAYGTLVELSPSGSRASFNSSDSSENLLQRAVPEFRLSPTQALFHLLKALLGTGLLALPLAFRRSGLYVGLCFVFVICFVNIWCMRRLVLAEHFYCKKLKLTSLDYGNLARMALENGPIQLQRFGNAAKIVINVNIFMVNLGLCSVYFVFMADTLTQVFQEQFDINISIQGWLCIIFLPVFLLCCIRQLSNLSFFSYIGMALYCGTLLITFGYIFWDFKFKPSLPRSSISGLPLYFSTVVYALEAVTVILPIENRLTKPTDFTDCNGVLLTACNIVTCLYAGMGFFGYLKFGDEVQANITLNLPDEWYFQLVKLLLALALLVNYCIQFHVPAAVLEKYLQNHYNGDRILLWIYGMRFGLVFGTFLLALLIPHLDIFISLVGAFAMTTVALLFPAIIDLLHLKNRYGSINYWQWARNICIMIVAVVGICTGTFASIYELILAYSG